MTAPASALPRSTLAFRGVFWSAVNVIIPTAASLLVFVFTSRLLTPRVFGIVALANALVAGGVALVPGGFGDALVQRMEMRSDYLDSVFWLSIGCGGGIYLGFVALASQLAHWFGAAQIRVLLPVLGLRIIAEAVAVVPNAILVQSLAFHLMTVRTLLASVLAAAAAIALVLSGYGWWALVASLLINAVVGAGAMVATTRYRPRSWPRWSVLRQLSGYGAYASGIRLLTFVSASADQAVVGLELGVRQLGYYNFSRRVFAILNDVTSGALSAVAHPLFAGIQNDRARVRSGFLTATFIASVIALPVFVGLACVADRAIPLLFGDQWYPAVWPIRILCALGLITCIGMVQAGLITSLGRANWWFWYQLLGGLANIPIILIVSRHGTVALLMALVAKTYLFWPIPVVMTMRLLGLRARDYLLQFGAPILASICLAVAIMAARYWLPALHGALALGCDVICGGGTYCAVLALTSRQRLVALARLALGGRRRIGARQAA